tara:strand:+ start:493 stop:819 length:327 start_codon:yes stop_codon:yes gene_type:complete
MKIYYNPKCSKCRIALERIGEAEKIEYLKTPPSEDELKEILKKLNMKAKEIIRKKEPVFEEFKNKDYSEEEWITILVDNPILIQRPIIVKGNKAVIGRTEEKLKEIID